MASGRLLLGLSFVLFFFFSLFLSVSPCDEDSDFLIFGGVLPLVLIEVACRYDDDVPTELLI